MEHAMNVVGVMSGTSLDGLDIVLASFRGLDPIEYRILATRHVAYEDSWKKRLSDALFSDAATLARLDDEYGAWLGHRIADFLRDSGTQADLIGSHGHTVFHRPAEGITLQVGAGKRIRELSDVPVVCNFRQQDVKMGGQGAPLVPVGDALLFGAFDCCLNLGGFSNASWQQDGRRHACDLAPCNMLLNALSTREGREYDPEGSLARSGNVLAGLLNVWDDLAFYRQSPPKSLGREWFLEHFSAEVRDSSLATRDLLRTAVEHIARQIDAFLSRVLPDQPSPARVLCTGGGAHNLYLMERLRLLGRERLEYLIPDRELVDCKEALVFALLAYLRWHGRNNILATVTGASSDHSSGDVYR
ncbi:MAG: anhydro-N-acetylmuramic acid kinase [Saprospiraceae bacterium]|nr:anhydro-N-acetylmuramic acid kinase [Saprospiraceae bacterium]